MELLTKVNIKPSEKKIGYQDRILLLGSCFADNIGRKFEERYFQTTVNPMGTLYNPTSIAEAVVLACSMSSISQAQIVEWDGMWHSMLHHGSFSHMDKNELIVRCENSINTLSDSIKVANVIIVTFGTAWVYEYKGKVVANCHKIPAKEFVRRRLTMEEIVQTWQPIIEKMSDKHWIFTVSPIRHIKDGLHENQISKALLLQAVDGLRSRLSSHVPSIDYFPSYEIMLDELRDYRFYAEDMVHPSEVAVNYIWQRFVETYMHSDVCNEMRVLHQLWRDRNHRFLHPDSQEAQAFVSHLQDKIRQLRKKYPWLE
jgi:hypothetical protein